MMTPLERQLYDALLAASDHLDYCGYGDSWERECAVEHKLEERITQALEATRRAYPKLRKTTLDFSESLFYLPYNLHHTTQS